LPSPNTLRGKILIKNKKKHEKNEKKSNDANTSEKEREESPFNFVRSLLGESIAAAGENESGESESDEDDGDEDANRRQQQQQQLQQPQQQPPPPATAKSRGQVKREEEAAAAAEISAIVNYVTAVKFHGFDKAESEQTIAFPAPFYRTSFPASEKNRSYEMSSFDEKDAVSYLKEFPKEFVKYNKRQFSRIFPRGTRLDSSNFMPQVHHHVHHCHVNLSSI